jgi:hypothetical protein
VVSRDAGRIANPDNESGFHTGDSPSHAPSPPLLSGHYLQGALHWRSPRAAGLHEKVREHVDPQPSFVTREQSQMIGAEFNLSHTSQQRGHIQQPVFAMRMLICPGYFDIGR